MLVYRKSVELLAVSDRSFSPGVPFLLHLVSNKKYFVVFLWILYIAIAGVPPALATKPSPNVASGSSDNDALPGRTRWPIPRHLNENGGIISVSVVIGGQERIGKCASSSLPSVFRVVRGLYRELRDLIRSQTSASSVQNAPSSLTASKPSGFEQVPVHSSTRAFGEDALHASPPGRPTSSSRINNEDDDGLPRAAAEKPTSQGSVEEATLSSQSPNQHSDVVFPDQRVAKPSATNRSAVLSPALETRSIFSEEGWDFSAAPLPAAHQTFESGSVLVTETAVPLLVGPTAPGKRPHASQTPEGSKSRRQSHLLVTRHLFAWVARVVKVVRKRPLNFGDLACAAMPEPDTQQSLACLFLDVIFDSARCRPERFKTCAVLRKRKELGESLVSPVNLPPPGVSALALELQPLLLGDASSHGVLPILVPSDVVSREGASYQLLWQAVMRLDELWDVAFCGESLSTKPSFDKVVPKEPSDRTPTPEVNREAFLRGESNGLPLGLAPKSAGIRVGRHGDGGAKQNEDSSAEGRGEEFAFDIELLPEWKTELALRALSPGVGSQTNILALLSRRGSSVLLTFRSTKTQAEWLLNARTEHAFQMKNEWQGNTASGFAHIAAAVWPALSRHLVALEKDRPFSRIVVTGYSMGGAVAALTAYELALRFPGKVEAVLFGSPRVGDSTFNAAWAKAVNGRALSFSLDPIPRTPCAKMPVCRRTSDGFEHAAGPGLDTLSAAGLRKATDRGEGSSSSADFVSSQTASYSDFSGRVEFTADDLGTAGPMQNPVFMAYNHLCSYACWLAKTFNSNEKKTFCKPPALGDPQWQPGIPKDVCPTLLP